MRGGRSILATGSRIKCSFKGGMEAGEKILFIIFFLSFLFLFFISLLVTVSASFHVCIVAYRKGRIDGGEKVDFSPLSTLKKEGKVIIIPKRCLACFALFPFLKSFFVKLWMVVGVPTRCVMFFSFFLLHFSDGSHREPPCQ